MISPWRLLRSLPEPVRRPAERLGRAWAQLEHVINQLDALRSRMDLGDDLVETFRRDRASAAYQSAFTQSDPLVSVCVGTYNRGALLVERSVRSILAQSHRNLQLIVIGDHCTDDTEKRMAAIRDSRLHFENLAVRGAYPEVKEWRWMVAGTVPFNRGLELAEGQFVTHLDDDDEYMVDRLEKLLALAQRERADLVWHPFEYQAPDGGWLTNEAPFFQTSLVTTSSVLYHHWLRRIPWDIKAYLYREPGDANRFRKFRYLGVEARRHPESLLKHYIEHAQRAG